ncbi:MAG: hypothetical protein CM15mP102_12850 [Flavobacteriales bacterium]|nr:MAG: hypothetical protein CM15mP102_12850 [Flavobacteriales bacterium]
MDRERKKLYGLNASGRSLKSYLEYFKENNFKSIPAYGPLPVSVPVVLMDGLNFIINLEKLK